MKSKNYFEEFKDDIKKEHEEYKTYLESTDIPQDRCNHKGKVKIEGNMLMCTCGAGWSGPEIEMLFDYFNSK
jgi:hypothetical protein